jgi:transposase
MAAGMIDIGKYGEIRRLKNEGVSQRKIAKKLGLSRSTVAKYCDGGHIPGLSEPRAPVESAAKAEIMEAIREYCEGHENDQTCKQKINGKTLWRDLRRRYPRSQATYRRYWAEIRGERQVRTRLPLQFKIAEAAEVDWKTAKVRIRGVKTDVHILCVTFMYGYTPFMRAYPNEKQYNLVDGLVCAFEFYQGAVSKLVMDNMAAARKKGYGKAAELTDEFRLFTAHYGLTVEFANIREAEEKGAVEVLAKTAGNVLTPIMDVNDFSEINDRLLSECLYYIEETGRVGNRPGTVREMTLEERPYLTPLPLKRYEVCVYDAAGVNNQQLFEFDKHLYSAPRPYAGKKIGIKAYSYKVEFYYRGLKIWECGRPLFEAENRVYAEHYMYDLKIKPRSRENAFPLLEGVLPPELHKFRALCKSRTSKCYQLYMLMRIMEDVGREILLKAVEIANATGSPTLKKVEDILFIEAGGGAADIDGLDCALPEDEFHVEQRDLSDYDVLWPQDKL